MVIEIRPQPGPQSDFLKSSADIALYGGAAGGGKTYALLLENVRNTGISSFKAVTFRRLSTMVRNEGGLWDTSTEFYPQLGAKGSDQMLEWEFPSGATVRFAHMQYESDKLSYQGAQIPLIGFDELTHFSRTQFWYMVSRNRSMSGVKPYIRATCNPDSESWVKRDFAPWVDDEYPGVKASSGEIRWFVRIMGQMMWEDKHGRPLTPTFRGPEGERPKSMTFIKADIFDNKIMMEKDPGYLANLQSLTLVDRARLLGGDWNIAAEPGNVFKREWFNLIDVVPIDVDMRKVRYWDFAGTEATNGKDPDWTAGALVGKAGDGRVFILDMQHDRLSPGGVERLVKQTAQMDGREVEIVIEQEPGSAGIHVINHYVTNVLNGYAVKGSRSTGSKGERAKPLSAQAEAQNVYLYDPFGRWCDKFLAEAELFPDSSHDDMVDAASGAFSELFETAVRFWDETDFNVTVELPERDEAEYRNTPHFKTKVW